MEFKNIFLKELCEIRTGYQGKKEEGSMYTLINPTDFNNDGIINLENSKTFGHNKINLKYVLKDQEILFKAKSSNYAVGIFENADGTGNLVPSGHFFILNIKSNLKEEISPKYIAWYLSEEKAQKHFKALASGMAMAIVKKSDLENLIVPIPPLFIQKKIADIQEEFIKEKVLLEKLISLKEKKIKNILNDLIK
ncbi:restriction endonuclease subunit S [Priestia megaterium]|nr:restriction endonuclease subunit S [Priestia megaterium]